MIAARSSAPASTVPVLSNTIRRMPMSRCDVAAPFVRQLDARPRRRPCGRRARTGSPGSGGPAAACRPRACCSGSRRPSTAAGATRALPYEPTRNVRPCRPMSVLSPSKTIGVAVAARARVGQRQVGDDSRRLARTRPDVDARLVREQHPVVRRRVGDLDQRARGPGVDDRQAQRVAAAGHVDRAAGRRGVQRGVDRAERAPRAREVGEVPVAPGRAPQERFSVGLGGDREPPRACRHTKQRGGAGASPGEVRSDRAWFRVAPSHPCDLCGRPRLSSSRPSASCVRVVRPGGVRGGVLARRATARTELPGESALSGRSLKCRIIAASRCFVTNVAFPAMKNLICVLVAASLLAACGGGEKPGAPGPGPVVRPSILLVTLDTTRADAVGPDASGVKTPAFNALAATGRRFRQAYATVPETLPSHVSMMTGLYPAGHGIHENARFLGPQHAVARRAAAVRRATATAAFVSSFVLARPVRPRPRLRRLRRRAGRRAGRTLGEGHDGPRHRVPREPASTQPAFVWVHYFDPHAPYAPPEPFRTRYAQAPYLGEVAAMDEQLGRLVQAFEQRHARRRTRSSSSATTARGSGDHGEAQHGNLLYQSTMHVPMVIGGPGVHGGRRATRR